MSEHTTISCTESTWNPVTGCTHLSRGCDNCYAERFSNRFRNVPGHPYETGFDLTLRPARIELPLAWKRSRLIFVNSMSDLFHKDVPSDYVDRVFDVMEEADWHHYQILTKRSARMRDYVNARYGSNAAPRHIWLGVSIESQAVLRRFAHLQQAAAKTRFICFEPLLGPIRPFETDGLHWVIVSGESGPGARPMMSSWVRTIRDLCVANKIPFFFKQWGGTRPKKAGNELDGRSWAQYPSFFPAH